MSPIIATSGNSPAGDFQPCPAGTFAARLVDVSEVFIERKQFGNEEPKDVKRVTLAWQVSEEMEDGRPFIITNRYTLSVHPKARLRPVVVSLLGRGLNTDEEMHGVDLEGLIGTDCLLGVVQNTDAQGGVWANVNNLMALPKGMAPVKRAEYTRWKDREKKPKWWPEHRVVEEAKTNATGHGWAPEALPARKPALDADLPF